MIDTTTLMQGGEPHANETAALPTPARQMIVQEVSKPRADSAESRGDNPPVTGMAQPEGEHLTERSGTTPVLDGTLARELLAVRDRRAGLYSSDRPEAERMAALAETFRQEEVLWGARLDIDAPYAVQAVLLTALALARFDAGEKAAKYEGYALSAADRAARQADTTPTQAT